MIGGAIGGVKPSMKKLVEDSIIQDEKDTFILDLARAIIIVVALIFMVAYTIFVDGIPLERVIAYLGIQGIVTCIIAIIAIIIIAVKVELRR